VKHLVAKTTTNDRTAALHESTKATVINRKEKGKEVAIEGTYPIGALIAHEGSRT